MLCYLEGLTHEQAARRLGWPVGTVRSRLARARDRLRADLTRRGTGPDAALLPMLAFRKILLPQGLIDATVRAAILLSARDAGEAGLVSASAVALTEGVLRTMLVSKFKVIAVILIAVGALTSGVGLCAYQDTSPAQLPGPWVRLRSGHAPSNIAGNWRQLDGRRQRAGRLRRGGGTTGASCPTGSKQRANGTEPPVTCARAWRSLASGERH